MILETLLPRLRPVLSKRMGLVLGLWGEAGIGKTWTAGQLIAQTPCKNFTLHSTVSLSQLVQTLPRPGKLPLWAERVVERLEQGEHLDTAPAADALAALLAALAPVILHLEDLHEASPDRIELITALAGRVKHSKGAAIVITSRTQPPEPFEGVRLETLSAQAAAEVLEGEVGAQLPKEGLTWIYQHALGNPLFSLEYLRHLTRMGNLWSDGQGWHWRSPPKDLMPVTIEALIEQQLFGASQGEALQKALDARAILPLEASTELWAEVAGLELAQLEQDRLELVQHGILQGPNFAHPLFREVHLKGLRPERRQALARRAIEVLDHPESAAPFVKDAGLEPSQALQLLKQAAQSARQRNNEVQAALFLAQATEYAATKERGNLAFEAAKGLSNHDLEEAKRLVLEAVKVSPHDPELIYFYGRLLAIQGKKEELEQLLSTLPAQERSSLRGLGQQIRLLAELGDRTTALEIWHQHPELVTNAEPELLRRVASSLANVGRTADAFTLAAQALSRPELSDLERATLTEVCGISRFYESDYLMAEQYFAQAIEIFRKMGQERMAAASLFNQGLAFHKLGHYQQALKTIESVVSLSGEAGKIRLYGQAKTLLGEQWLELGNYQQSETALLEAKTIFEQLPPGIHRVDIYGNLCDLYCDWGSLHSGMLALKYGRAALSTARSLDNPFFILEGLFYAAVAEARFGNPDEALKLAEEEAERALLSKIPRKLYKAAWALGHALRAQGRKAEAVAQLSDAFTRANGAGVGLHARKIGLELARLNGDLEQAREHLEWFRQHGLMNGVNLAQRYFPELEEKAGFGLRAQGTEKIFSGARNPVPGSLSHSKPGTRNPVLKLLGPMHFEGQPVRGQKRKELLALLAEARIAGRSEVGLLELLETLYLGIPELEAENLLRQLVFQTRNSLGQEVILTGSAGYALGAVDSDAETFLRSDDTRLWRGAYRADVEGEADANISEALHRALAQQGLRLLPDDPIEAARIGKILLEADPYSSEYLTLTLKALRASDNHKSLTRLYAQARAHFLEVGQVLPEKWTGFLS